MSRQDNRSPAYTSRAELLVVEVRGMDHPTSAQLTDPWRANARAWHDVLRPVAAEFLSDPSGQATALCHQAFERNTGLPRSVRDAAIASATANFTFIFGAMREGIAAEQVSFPPASMHFARECSRAGVPAAQMIALSTTGAELLSRHCVSAARARCPDPELLVDAITIMSEFFLGYAHRAYAHWGEEYLLERDDAVRNRFAARLEIVHALLDGTRTVPEHAGTRLGYDLAGLHRGFLLWSDTARDIEDLQHHVLGAAQRHALPVPLMIPRGEATVAGWLPGPAAARPDLFTDSDRAVRVALGEPHVGVSGFRRTHDEATEARRVAGLMPDRSDRLVRYGEVALTALLTIDLDQARRFVAGELAGLAADDENTRRLADTLTVYLEQRDSPRRTAERLFVHENTVKYRVRNAEQLLGRDLTHRRAELEAALRLLPLLRPVGPTPPGSG